MQYQISDIYFILCYPGNLMNLNIAGMHAHFCDIGFKRDFYSGSMQCSAVQRSSHFLAFGIKDWRPTDSAFCR